MKKKLFHVRGTARKKDLEKYIKLKRRTVCVYCMCDRQDREVPCAWLSLLTRSERSVSVMRQDEDVPGALQLAAPTNSVP